MLILTSERLNRGGRRVDVRAPLAMQTREPIEGAMGDVVRVRVVAEEHPKYRKTGTVALEAFEQAAREQAQGEFTAQFRDGPHLVYFHQVEVVAIADGHLVVPGTVLPGVHSRDD
jgi:hypothetical protein